MATERTGSGGRQHRWLPGVILALALVASACGSDAEVSSEPTDPPPSPAVEATIGTDGEEVSPPVEPGSGEASDEDLGSWPAPVIGEIVLSTEAREGPAIFALLERGGVTVLDPQIDGPGGRVRPSPRPGHSSKTIGERIHVLARTVDNHVRAVYRILGITGREELPAPFPWNGGGESGDNPLG
mgnify:FL=1